MVGRTLKSLHIAQGWLDKVITTKMAREAIEQLYPGSSLEEWVQRVNEIKLELRKRSRMISTEVRN